MFFLAWASRRPALAVKRATSSSSPHDRICSFITAFRSSSAIAAASIASSSSSARRRVAGSNGTGFFGKYQQTLLEPTDPLFQAIGKTWIEEQSKLYGSDHIYQCDTYNEMQPPTADPAYLRRSAAAVYAASSFRSR